MVNHFLKSCNSITSIQLSSSMNNLNWIYMRRSYDDINNIHGYILHLCIYIKNQNGKKRWREEKRTKDMRKGVDYNPCDWIESFVGNPCSTSYTSHIESLFTSKFILGWKKEWETKRNIKNDTKEDEDCKRYR